MIVCENCIHRYVCEDKYTMEPQYGCINYNSGKYMVIEELEKIRSKINLEDVDCQYEEDYIYSGGLQKAIEIIDEEISELKGE